MQNTKLQRFNSQVLSRYNIYNSIFITLPFQDISNTGVLLPLFQSICQEGFNKKKNPTQIVEEFFKKYESHFDESEQINLLFKFIQFIERQVVLFDAIEDAAFPVINNLDGRGTLRNVKEEAQDKQSLETLKDYLERFKIRPVLTAHPTQFYPGAVLGIITDLAEAIANNNLDLIKDLLAQLGKTPFFKKEKPTPYDEAVRLIWYLENVFYQAATRIFRYIDTHIFTDQPLDNQIINLGFWPGGDRDGNPFVTPQITLDVAQRLRATVLKNYYRDLRKLRRRITFNGVEAISSKLEKDIYDHIFKAHGKLTLTADNILDRLGQIREIIVNEHQGLFLEQLEELMSKVRLFGLYFASLDIRQDSRVHSTVMAAIADETENILPNNYALLSEQEKVAILEQPMNPIDSTQLTTKIAQQTIGSIEAMKVIQKNNGELGSNRYIISNNGSVLNVLEAFAMVRMCDWNSPTVDIVPLFETVEDLEMAHKVMEVLYHNPMYRAHLERRGNRQSVMLGFSDGTKDGGYLMANWGIFTAKERITEMSRANGITVIFFDGRGGPPARGGGKTHQFYASLGETVEHEEVQLTIQGQTISSNFGTPEACQYNLEQLISSGIVNEVFADGHSQFNEQQRQTMQGLADLSYKAYQDFKAHPKFLPYLEQMSTLKYYGMANIGSRPSKRGKKEGLDFKDLRAIPFVGSWSQLKQNVPGFYGVGTAVNKFKEEGNLEEVKALYRESSFFRTLIENSMMSLTKSFFPLTAYMKDDPEFGPFWNKIYEEFERTKALLLEISESDSLMQEAPAMLASINMREKIVLPLLTIQQYALKKIQELKANGATPEQLSVWEKMVTRSLFGNINAARNSA